MTDKRENKDSDEEVQNRLKGFMKNGFSIPWWIDCVRRDLEKKNS